jgi:hypothetical protein
MLVVDTVFISAVSEPFRRRATAIGLRSAKFRSVDLTS